MEDERNTQSHQGGEADQVQVTDRGFLGNLLGKKKTEEEDKKEEEVLVSGMEKVSVEEQPEVKKEEHEGGDKKESLLSKLHRSGSSSSSSSSDEEEEVIDDNGEVIKRKKKKGLKEKIKEKLPSGHKDGEAEHATGLPAPAPPASVQTYGDTAVAVEKVDGDVKTEAPPAVPEEEKKGFLEKIKEKLPGGHKKPEDAPVAHAAPAPVHAPAHAAPAPVHAPAPAATEDVSSPEGKEKKGLLGKIMDKLPGYHKAAGEEDKAAGEHKTSG